MPDTEHTFAPSIEEAVAHERLLIIEWHRRRAHEHKAQAVSMCQPYRDGDRSREGERRFEHGVKRNSLATMHYAAAEAIEKGEHHGVDPPECEKCGARRDEPACAHPDCKGHTNG